MHRSILKLYKYTKIMVDLIATISLDSSCTISIGEIKLFVLSNSSITSMQAYICLVPVVLLLIIRPQLTSCEDPSQITVFKKNNSMRTTTKGRSQCLTRTYLNDHAPPTQNIKNVKKLSLTKYAYIL